MPKRKRRTGKDQESDRYLKWDAVARLMDAAVGIVRLFVGR